MVLRRWTFRWILGPPWRPRGGDTAAAEEEVGELARLGDALTATKSGYWTTEVEVSRLAAASAESQEPATRLALYARCFRLETSLRANAVVPAYSRQKRIRPSRGSHPRHVRVDTRSLMMPNRALWPTPWRFAPRRFSCSLRSGGVAERGHGIPLG
jgi:hypothetical protein